MKKVLVIFLAIIIGLSMSAQIQNKILGFTLGTTSKTTVLNQYKTKITKADYNAGETYRIQDVSFAGQIWDLAYFVFVNNKLCTVSFQSTDDNIPTSILDLSWENLKKSLNKKYSQFYLSNRSTSEIKEYSDGTTYLTLSYEYFMYCMVLNISYTNEYLLHQKVKAAEDDL